MNGVGQAAKRGAEGFLAHMPRLHPEQRAPRSCIADLRHARQPEVGGFGDQRSEECSLVRGRQPGGDMPEAADKPRPAADTQQHVGDPNCRNQPVGPEGKLLRPIVVVVTRFFGEAQFIADKKCTILARQAASEVEQAGVEPRRRAS